MEKEGDTDSRVLSNNEMLELIELYKHSEALWNDEVKFDDRYTLIEEAYKNIGAQLNLTPASVREKIKMLRISFFTEKRRMERAQKSVSSRRRKYRPSFIWYNNLKFLDKNTTDISYEDYNTSIEAKHKSQKTNLNRSKQSHQEYSSEDSRIHEIQEEHAYTTPDGLFEIDIKPEIDMENEIFEYEVIEENLDDLIQFKKSNNSSNSKHQSFENIDDLSSQDMPTKRVRYSSPHREYDLSSEMKTAFQSITNCVQFINKKMNTLDEKPAVTHCLSCCINTREAVNYQRESLEIQKRNLELQMKISEQLKNIQDNMIITYEYNPNPEDSTSSFQKLTITPVLTSQNKTVNVKQVNSKNQKVGKTFNIGSTRFINDLVEFNLKPDTSNDLKDPSSGSSNSTRQKSRPFAKKTTTVLNNSKTSNKLQAVNKMNVQDFEKSPLSISGSQPVVVFKKVEGNPNTESTSKSNKPQQIVIQKVETMGKDEKIQNFSKDKNSLKIINNKTKQLTMRGENVNSSDETVDADEIESLLDTKEQIEENDDHVEEEIVEEALISQVQFQEKMEGQKHKEIKVSADFPNTKTSFQCPKVKKKFLHKISGIEEAKEELRNDSSIDKTNDERTGEDSTINEMDDKMQADIRLDGVNEEILEHSTESAHDDSQERTNDDANNSDIEYVEPPDPLAI